MTTRWVYPLYEHGIQLRTEDGAVLCRVYAPGWPNPAFCFESKLMGTTRWPMEAMSLEEAKREAEEILMAAAGTDGGLGHECANQLSG